MVLGAGNSESAPAWEARDQHAEALISAALAAVDPSQAVGRHLKLQGDSLVVGEREYHLGSSRRVIVVGAGKAGVAMGLACQRILGDRLAGGVMAVPSPPKEAGSIRWLAAGHPVPNAGSVRAGREIAELVRSASEQDVVLALISGGGSALLELPVEGVSLADLQTTTDLLLRSGASIHEINSLRHQLSQIKGGGLARMAAPAPMAALILSDVVGDQLDIIASGPTVPPTSTPQEAMAVIQRYDLEDQLPATVLARVEAEMTGEKAETPACHNLLIGSNRQAALAAQDRAGEIGFRAAILTNFLEGEAVEAGRFVAALVKSVREYGDPIQPPACLILGGETTVRVTGDGVGGRNQELALSAALELDGYERCQVITLATDGVDGPTPSAGAIVTGQTIERGRAAGLAARAHLEDNDSHTFLAALEADLRLGPTGTNVNDLTFLMIYE